MTDLPTITRFVAFSCTHAPLMDEDAIGWLCDVVNEVKPELLVHLGDLYEANSASRWPDSLEVDYTLTDEFREADFMLHHIRRSAPDGVKCVFCPGNHDDNLLAIARIDKRLRERCDWRIRQYDADNEWINEERMTHWPAACEYVYDQKRGAFRVGQVTFFHGYEAGQSGDRFQSVTMGIPYGLTVSGHTHRPRRVEQLMLTQTIPMPRWYANTGCLTDLKPRYMQRQRTVMWGHGCVVGEIDTRGTPRGQRIANGPRWSAETRIMRTG